MQRVIRIGLLGCGIVGGGVVEVLHQKKAHIEEACGASLELTRIAVRDLNRPRNPHVPLERLVGEWRAVCEDPEIDLVIEAIGGVHPAYDAVRQALMTGKHVITANKELLAYHGEELLEMASTQGRILLFEASVLGGIPALHTLESYFVANGVQKIGGIVNSTCNFILTRMSQSRVPMMQALVEAQAAGYTERDPTFDIEGYDAFFKLQILTRCAFQAKADFSEIPRRGIRSVQEVDIELAASLGCQLKHVVQAQVSADGQTIGLLNGPMLVEQDNPLYGVNDVQNALLIEGDLVGTVMLTGSGAGALPTASAILEDVVKVVRNTVKPWVVRRLMRASHLPVEAMLVRFRHKEGARNEDLEAHLRQLFNTPEVHPLAIERADVQAFVVRGEDLLRPDFWEGLQALEAGEVACYPFASQQTAAFPVADEMKLDEWVGPLYHLALPYEREYEMMDNRWQHITQRLDDTVRQAFEREAAESGIPMEQYLLAGWQTLLYRLTGETTLVTVLDAKGAQGDYVPLWTCLEPDWTFAAAVRQIHQAIQSKRHAATVDWRRLEELANVEPGAVFANGFSVVEQEGASDSASDRFRVRLVVHAADESTDLELCYDGRRLAEEDMQRVLSSYQALLKSAVDQPSTPLWKLSVLSSEDYRLLMITWNDTDNGASEEDCLHELFEAQVERTPNLTALIYDDFSLSYRELNERANALAHRLQALGVQPGQLIALFMERSPEVAIGMLAILKAGGAFVPIDPKYPRERVGFMLEDTQATIVVTQEKFLDLLEGFDLRTVVVDAKAPVSVEHTSNPCSTVTAYDLAYAIYTSGSTGRPKGALLEHRNLVNHIRSVNEKIPFGEGDHFAYVSTFAADVGLTVLFGALLTGGCLHVISEEMGAEPEKLMQYFMTHRIDFFKIVPSHLATLLMLGAEAEKLLPHKFLMMGGEELRWNWVSRLQEIGKCRIFNHYGHTEAGVGTFLYPLSDDRPTRRVAPIGRPMANTKVYVLDANMQPVPIGVPGELYVAGRSVGRGYLNREDLNREKFLTDPFSQQPNVRMYRSGDRVRFLPDGNLEFLERVDHQVKIRGFRVEIGEIEHALEQNAAVQKAVVVTRESQDGDSQLDAYLVLKPELHPPKVSELRRELMTILPSYMIPRTFTFLERFPLTHNGKIDRKALPDPLAAASAPKPEPEEWTEVERALLTIWERVLGTNRIDRESRFGDLGGDAERAAEIMQLVRLAFQLDVPLPELHSDTTLSEWALVLEDALLKEIEALG
jgi:amino acid adenylation domain-containing protein